VSMARPFQALVGWLLLGWGEGREVLDKTPTPCKSEYDKDFISEMAEKYLAEVPANQDAPRMLLLLGGSGAGKGTFIKLLTKHGFPAKDYAMHGIDDYLEMLPEWRQSAADPKSVYKDAADGCYGGAIPIAKAAQKKLIERRMHVIYEETGKNLERVLKRVVPPFADAGYRITVALVDSTPEIAKQRAEGRFQAEGRYSSPEYVEGTFKNVFENYLTLRTKDFAAETLYCDNSCTSQESSTGAGEAAQPWSCMKCWDDSAAEESGAGGTARLAPAGALEPGQAQYMKGRAPKPAHEEM